MKLFKVQEIGHFDAEVIREYGPAHSHYDIAKWLSFILSENVEGDRFGFVRNEKPNTQVWYVIEPFFTGTAMRQFRITEV